MEYLVGYCNYLILINRRNQSRYKCKDNNGFSKKRLIKFKGVTFSNTFKGTIPEKKQIMIEGLQSQQEDLTRHAGRGSQFANLNLFGKIPHGSSVYL
jgi:hypothetical protein